MSQRLNQKHTEKAVLSETYIKNAFTTPNLGVCGRVQKLQNESNSYWNKPKLFRVLYQTNQPFNLIHGSTNVSSKHETDAKHLSIIFQQLRLINTQKVFSGNLAFAIPRLFECEIQVRENSFHCCFHKSKLPVLFWSVNQLTKLKCLIRTRIVHLIWVKTRNTAVWTFKSSLQIFRVSYQNIHLFSSNQGSRNVKLKLATVGALIQNTETTSEELSSAYQFSHIKVFSACL